MNTKNNPFTFGHYVFLFILALASIFGGIANIAYQNEQISGITLEKILENEELTENLFITLFMIFFPIITFLKTDIVSHFIISKLSRIFPFSWYFIDSIHHYTYKDLYSTLKFCINYAENNNISLNLISVSIDQFYFNCLMEVKPNSNITLKKLEQAVQTKFADVYIRKKNKHHWMIFITK